MSSSPLFVDFDLRDEVKSAVTACGYETPTPVQAQIIPHMLAGRDVLAQSQTGTGKTAAFALPILSTLRLPEHPDAHPGAPQVLVLAPTRELAIQVSKSFATYSQELPGVSVAAIYGGQDYQPQLIQLRRGVQIVVGTPGRVIDHVKQGTLKLDQIRCLVLDEADEMLNMGFLEDVQFVLSHLPDQRQIALFSATMPEPIRQIADEYLHDPARITIRDKAVTASSIRQRALVVPPREKIDTLFRLLEVETTDGVIVFTKTKDATISVADALTRQGFSAIALNGDMPQKVRERAIEQLKKGRLNILVATDVAARGLDVQRVSHVINFDLPHDSESYIHRVGRTGRAGRTGEAILMLTGAQRGRLKQIERATRQPIEWMKIPTADEVNQVRIAKFAARITKTTAEQDLTFFKDLISQYAEESGKPLEMIAAALAHINQRGRPFLLKDVPKPKRESRGRNHEDSRDAGRKQRGRESGRESGFEKGKRVVKPVEPGMVRYRIQVGWRDGVKPGNIVGAVASEGGIDGSCIGPINIRDGHSTIDLPEGMPPDIYQTLRKTWVAGKRLNLELDDGKRDAGGYRGGRNDFSDQKSGKKKRFGKKKDHGKKQKRKPHAKDKSGKKIKNHKS